jgi:hypothetical protein
MISLTLGLSPWTVRAEPRSHPPLRSLESPVGRAATEGPGFFVDPNRGDDKNDGNRDKPWRTMAHAIKQLRPGDTLNLRGGVYRESIYLARSGRANAPLTIRSAPGEKAIIDAGLPEFFDTPSTAWEPLDKGGPGEYRSKKAYANLRDVLGSFGDSMVGLQTYHHAIDLRATSEVFDWEDWNRTAETDLKPVYLGPGVWYDRETGHIHIRLAHTNLPAPIANYKGETDPRKLPLMLAGFNAIPLHLDGARHIQIQDLTIRGAGYTAVHLDHAQHVEFDNVTIWCGTYGMRVGQTGPLKINKCRMHGNVAPWTFRSDGSKRDYPGRPHRNLSRMNTHAILEIDSGRESSVYATPQNDNWEIAHSEFTDAHDGLYFGSINVKFHHNRIDGLQDDGIYLSPMYMRHRLDKKDPEIHIYQNHFGAMLTALAFGGTEAVTHDQVFVYRNVFDLRGPVQTGRPTTKSAKAGISTGKVIGDHGSPPWSAMNIYHNTFIASGCRDAAMATYAGTRAGNPRRVLNNLFIHTDRLPAYTGPDANLNSAADGNVFWAMGTNEKVAAGFFDRYRKSEPFTASKKLMPSGSDVNSRVVDPLIGKDYQPAMASPIKNTGVEVPKEWPDPEKAKDEGKPDVGAIPIK